MIIHFGIGNRGGHGNVQREVKFTALDASGTIVTTTSSTVLPRGGFGNEMRISSSAPNIASIQIEAIDPTANTNLGISNITIDNPVFATPDFSLQGNSFYEVLSGSNNVSPLINILRYGGSSGAINFTADNVPGGVQIVFGNTSVPGNVCGFNIVASAGAIEGSYSIKITGTPAAASAGSAPRTLTVNLKVSQAFNLYGLRNINFDDVQNNGSGKGIISLPLTIIRNAKVTAPAKISIDLVSSSLTANFSKTDFAFAGSSLGENTVLTFTADAGIDISALLVIHITNGMFTDDFYMSVFGTVGRINKNFLVKGRFSTIQLGTERSIEGAVVEIYRDVTAALDDMVAETKTDANGRYEVSVSAHDVNTYYAKLRLTDHLAYLQDSWSFNVWDINSADRRENKGPVIDLGETIISNNDGSTTRATIWQGAHYAYMDYLLTSVKSPPPFGQYQVKMWKGLQAPFSFLNKTEWEEGLSTAFFDTVTNDVFADYETNFHEFGHTVRHYLDGSFGHFIYDAARFNYAQEHDRCDHNNDGFAFNEGWAEFWANEPLTTPGGYPCDPRPGFDTELKVAFDLQNLMKCANKTKKDMVLVLAMNGWGIHSEDEYRARFHDLFPEVDMSLCAPFVDTMHAPALHFQPIKLDSIHILMKLQKDISLAVRMADSLVKASSMASKEAEEIRSDKSANAQKLIEVICRPNMLQAQAKAAALLQKVFENELAAVQSGQRLRPQLTEQFDFSADSIATQFDIATKNIVEQLLKEDIAALTPLIASDTSGAIKKFVSEMNVKLSMINLKTAAGQDWYSMLDMPAIAGDYVVNKSTTTTDSIAEKGQKHGMWWWIIMGAAILVVVILIVYFLTRMK